MVQENIRMPMKCSRCGEKKMLGEMRLDKSGKNLICSDCLGNPMKKFMPNASSKSKKENIIEPKSTFMCESCGFTFSRSKIRPVRCPYCASNSIIVKEQVTSEKLLDLED